MRHAMVGLLGACAFCALTSAQQQAPPLFRGGTAIVPVDATVLDRDGKPVRDLAAGDFEIKIDGQVRTVRSIAYEQVTPPSTAALQPAAVSSPAREVSNATPAHQPRLVVMMLDDLSIPPSRGKGMFFAATKFVDSRPSTDIIGFTTSSNTAMMNPTTNRAAIDAALRHTVGEFIDPRDSPPKVGVNIADAVEVRAGDDSVRQQAIRTTCFGGRPVSQGEMAQSDCAANVDRKLRFVGEDSKFTTDRQIQAYIDTINAMREAPGLKELVVISDGIAVAQRQQLIEFQPVARAAAAAGVHLTVLSQDPDMLGHYADDRTRVFSLMTLTDMAGGDFYRVMGQPDRFFGFASDATSGIYHLGIELPVGTTLKKDMTVSARVKRSGLTVHANHVAVQPEALATRPVSERLTEAVTKGIANYGVPVTVGMALRKGQQGSIDLAANIEIPAGVQAPLTVMYGLMDQAGRVQTGREMIAAAPAADSYRITLTLPVESGKHRLRVAVSDAAGRVGSVDTPLDATLRTVGPFAASDVVMSWSNATTKPRFLALAELPPSATALQARIELYPALDQEAAGTKVRWRIVGPQGSKVTEVTVSSVALPDRLTAATDLPLTSLPPGEYELSAEVFVGDSAVGQLTTTFRKAAKDGSAPIDWLDRVRAVEPSPARPSSTSGLAK